MNRQRSNKLLSLAGSFLLSNGLLLVVAPDRFALLRRYDWLPERYNREITRLTADHRRSRAIGVSAMIAGLLLMVLAIGRTEPVR